MYRIGICDDGENVCVYLRDVILEFAQNIETVCCVETWNSGEALQKYLQSGNELDLLFLDIELLEMTGIEVGEYIRNRLDNHNMQIVYISGKTSYAQSLFKTQPLDFLVKPFQKDSVKEVLQLAMKILSINNSKFEFQIGKTYYSILYGEILYFCSNGRRIKIIRRDGGNSDEYEGEELQFYGKTKNLIDMLPKSFIMIHQSYIVNTEYILRYKYEEIELLNVVHHVILWKLKEELAGDEKAKVAQGIKENLEA